MNKKQIGILFAEGLGILTAALDGAIVTIALPVMTRELHTTTALVSWVMTLYLIVTSAVILTFGRLGDLLGGSRVFKMGIVIFTAGSLLAGLNFGLGLAFLLFARVIQALGGSMMMATGFGIISKAFPENIRARGLSIGAMFVSLGTLAGPALGGLILQVASWNFIFLINVPIGIIAYLLSRQVLPEDVRQGSISDLDLPGSLLMAAAMIFFFLAINFGSSLGWLSPLILGAFVLTIIFFIAFIRRENQAEKPLVNLSIFKTRLFSLSIITAVINFTAGMFVSILMPFYLQSFRGFNAGSSGLIILIYSLAMLIASLISGVLSDRFNQEMIAGIGITGIIIASFGYLFLGKASPILLILAILALHGFSTGFFQSPNNALIMNSVTSQYVGIAGSINSLGRNIASALGTSLATISLFAAMSLLSGHTISTYQPGQASLFIQGFHIAFMITLVLVAITWLLTFARLFGKKNRKIN